MTRIKLCGLTRPEDIETANELLPDYIGFVFFPKSKRNVERDQAAKLKAMLTPKIKAVGVFVNEDIDIIVDLLEAGIIDIAQLHGRESEEYIAHLRKKTDKPIFKAFRIDSREDVDKAANSSADCVLLDSGDGGTGTCFNWELLEDVKRPYILAGGLNSDNVEEAVRRLRPYGIDVSSGIETEGLKDSNKMKALVTKVKNA